MFKEYKSGNCDDEGKQEANLTAAQRRGLGKLIKRVKEGEIVVCQTDKSGKLAVMTLELYKAAGEVHTRNDEEIDMEKVKELEKICNGTSAMVMKIFNVGADWEHQDRHKETKVSHSQEVPILDMLYKDHKNWTPAVGEFPPFRPVALSNKGINIHLSELFSMIIEPVSSAWIGTMEVNSTDDLLSKADRFNARAELNKDVQAEPVITMARTKINPSNANYMEESESASPQLMDHPAVIIGADVVNHYPQLRVEASALAAKKAILLTDVKFNNINYKEAARYLALEMSDTEISLSGLRHVLPVRRSNKGTKPLVYGPLAMGNDTENDSQWRFPKIKLTEKDKRLLLATVIQMVVKTIFQTHVYQFGGKVYHQKQGGPIGLRATGAISRIVMGDWDLRLKEALTKVNVKVDEAGRYVDDIRLWLKAIKLGWRWDGKNLTFKKEWQEEEEGQEMSRTRKTAEVVGQIMNSLSSHITITTETHEDFQSRTLPTLDTQLWMDEEKTKYIFYEKPMADKRVLDRRTAMSENGLVASLTQEVVRRCKNCSEDLPQEDKNQVLDQYTIKLLSSGHSRTQAQKIITAGLKGYVRMLQRQEKGQSAIHKPSIEGLAQRNRKKLLSKTN